MEIYRSTHLPLSLAKGCLTAVLVASACLAGCQSTMHSRWAANKDSLDVWQPKMATLPIDVHGAIPGSSPDATLSAIRNATNSSVYAKAHPSASGLESQQRIVLYVGGETLPVNTTYCSATSTMRAVKLSTGRVLVGSALCDGSRLVVTARQEVEAEDATNATMEHTITTAKERLLVALRKGRNRNFLNSPDGPE